MKNTFVKVLSFMMALTMIVGAFGAITVSAADCAHEDRTAIETVAATCGTVGYTKYVCNDCGKEFPDAIVPAIGEHDYQVVPGTEPTCDEPAYKAYEKCSACGELKNGKDSDKVVDTTKNDGKELGHAYNIPYVQEATCTQEGFTSKKCARCDKVDTDNKTNVVTAAHDYIYTVVTAPTACVSGVVKVTCSACDYSEDIIQKEDHNWEDMTTTTDVKAGTTCQYEWNKGKYCVDCKAVHPDAVKNTTTTHTYKKVDFDTITADNIKAEIAALGYKMGDATSTGTADCEVSEIYLGQCTICGVYGKGENKVNEGKGHKWGNWTAYDIADNDANHNKDKTRTRTCQTCSAVDTEVKVADGKHNFVKQGDPVAATCIVNGFTNYKCSKCNEPKKDDVVYATGHTYGAWKYVAGYNCETSGTTNVCEKTCTNANCKNEDGKKTVKGNLSDMGVTTTPKHTMVKVTRDATCIADAYYENECSVCKATAPYEATSATDKPEAGKKPNNHVAKVTADGVIGVLATVGPDADEDGVIDVPGLLQAEIVEQTCTTSRVDKYMCQCGVAVNLTVGPAPAHNEVEGGTYHKHAAGSDACTADCKSVATKPATCKAEGIKTAGKICTVCGVITKNPEVAPIDSTKHTVDGVFVDEGKATCVSMAYTTSYYSCCGIVHKIETGNVDETAHGAKLKTVAKVDATCTAKGVAAHQKCEACGLLWTATQTTLTKANAVTLASLAVNTADGDLVHDWKTDAVPEVAEKCDTDGTKAYYECNDCKTHIKVDGQIVFDDPATEKNERTEAIKIPAHGTKYTGRYAYLYNEEVKPTCTAGAWGEIPNTPMCKKCVLDADKAAAEKKGEDGTYWLVKLDHKNTKTTPINQPGSPDYDCTKPSYYVVTCKDCDDYTVFKEYAKAVATAHNYERSGDNKIDDNDIYSSIAPTCTTAGVNTFKCTVDGCIGSYDVAGKPATGHYLVTTGGKVAITDSCKNDAWKEFDGISCSAEGCNLTISAATVKHNYIEDADGSKPATCTEDGYTIVYCTDCGDVKSATEIKAAGHEETDLISVENGVEKWSCGKCGEYWTKAVDAVIVETLSAEKIAAGEVVTYTYAVTGKETFSSYDVVIPYDAYGLVFVGVEANADLAGLYAFASAGEYYYYDEDSDSGYYYDGVGVSLVVEYDAEGNEQFVETSADTTTVLFTLTFVASKTASGDAYIGDQDLEIVALGDLNGDEIVTAADAQAIFKFIGTNNVAADVNADGIVNLADVAALATFAASAKTVKDYLVMVDEFDKLEDVVFALFEAGKLNDINGDRVVNISDAYYFIATMNEKFADAPYEMLGYVLGNNDITMEALVNYLNVMISANGGR